MKLNDLGFWDIANDLTDAKLYLIISLVTCILFIIFGIIILKTSIISLFIRGLVGFLCILSGMTMIYTFIFGMSGLVNSYSIEKSHHYSYVTLNEKIKVQDVKAEGDIEKNYVILNIDDTSYLMELPSNIHAKKDDVLSINSNKDLILNKKEKEIFLKNENKSDFIELKQAK